MDNATTAQTVEDGYLELSIRIRNAGLMACRTRRFALKAALTLSAFAAGWVALFLVGNSWWMIAVAAWLGFVSTQVVFFGHDAGHHQISDGRRGNRAVGLVAGNLLTGLSFGWWQPKHGAHHAHPNQIDRDPDIGPGAVAFTAMVAAGRSRTGHLAARWQAWTFFPLLSLEGIGLHVSSVRSLAGRRDRSALLEASLMALHTAAYLFAVFSVLGVVKAFVFIAVQQGIFGIYLGSTFAPNHKGMPTIPAGERVGFAQRQVLTARNVSGGPVVTYLLGGLNYQIEHHLFPKLPMANLVKVQPWIRSFCAEHGLSYHQDTLVGSYRATLRHLAAIGAGGADPSLPGTPGAKVLVGLSGR